MCTMLSIVSPMVFEGREIYQQIKLSNFLFQLKTWKTGVTKLTQEKQCSRLEPVRLTIYKVIYLLDVCAHDHLYFSFVILNHVMGYLG